MQMQRNNIGTIQAYSTNLTNRQKLVAALPLLKSGIAKDFRHYFIWCNLNPGTIDGWKIGNPIQSVVSAVLWIHL